MSLQEEAHGPVERGEAPRWLLPAIIGGVIALAALVTILITMRSAPAQPAAQSQPAAPAGAGSLAEPPLSTSSGQEAHGGLDPNGPPVEEIGLADAKVRFEAGTAIFVDVRSGAEYGAGHIPGALTITSQELDTRLRQLPEGVIIIAYGDAERPDSGKRGAQIFMELGYPTVIALEGGFQGWAAAGHPVEGSP